jgi:SAM-dependent methyltransferase
MLALGATRSRSELVSRYLRPGPGARILDLGCGPARILDHLPADVEYLGVDLCSAYISAAEARYRDRASFVCAPLSGFDVSTYGPFDLVLAIGVLHHLDDDEARRLFVGARASLVEGGRCVTVDPAFVEGQHPLARALASMDRGANVRTPTAYRRLAEATFADVRSVVRHDRLRIPYTHHIMEARR